MSVHTSARVWDHARVSGTRLVALLALADMSDQDGVCWPGIPTLTKRLRLKDERHTYRVIDDLADLSEVLIERNGQTGTRSNRYLVITGQTEREVNRIIRQRGLNIPVEQVADAFSRLRTPGEDVTPTPGENVRGGLAPAPGDPSIDPLPLLRSGTRPGQADMFAAPVKPTPAPKAAPAPAPAPKAPTPASIFFGAFRKTVTEAGLLVQMSKRQEALREYELIEPLPTADEVAEATKLVVNSLKLPATGVGYVWIDRIPDAILTVRARAKQSASRSTTQQEVTPLTSRLPTMNAADLEDGSW